MDDWRVERMAAVKSHPPPTGVLVGELGADAFFLKNVAKPASVSSNLASTSHLSVSGYSNKKGEQRMLLLRPLLARPSCPTGAVDSRVKTSITTSKVHSTCPAAISLEKRNAPRNGGSETAGTRRHLLADRHFGNNGASGLAVELRFNAAARQCMDSGQTKALAP